MEKTVERAAISAQQNKVRAIVMTALLAALACVATMIIHVPTPTNGYLNLGDAVVLLGAFLLGPWYGAAAAGIGSALADVLSGAAAWAPATLVIKALMAVVAALLYRKLKNHLPGILLCGAVAEVVMVAGYWLYEAWVMGSLLGAAVGIPFNLVQAAFGIAAGTLLTLALRKSRYVQERFPLL